MWTFLAIVVICSSLGWGSRGGRRRLSREAEIRIDDLTNRLADRDEEVDQLYSRVAEMENRLDFAERLLMDRTTVSGEEEPAETR